MTEPICVDKSDRSERFVDERENNESVMIEVRDVWKIFGSDVKGALKAVHANNVCRSDMFAKFNCVLAVAGVSFTVRRGEIFCIMGLSGSGKSTVVRHLNGLIAPTSGEIYIEGGDIGKKSPKELRQMRAEKISMVFQHFGLLPHRTVVENVAFGLELRNIPLARRLKKANEMLELVGLSEWGLRRPDELSGGMQQRVGLARALAGDPDIILMDEPFGALDPLIRRQLQDQFFTLTQTLNRTIVFITHDVDEALRFGSRVAIMQDGAIVQIGTPRQIIHDPINAYVSDFLNGASRLKVIRAVDIMKPVSRSEASRIPSEWPRANMDSDLRMLSGLASTSRSPTVVLNSSGESIGLIDRELLLQEIHGKGTE